MITVVSANGIIARDKTANDLAACNHAADICVKMQVRAQGEVLATRVDRIEAALSALSDAVPAARVALEEVTTAATASGVVIKKP